MGTQIRNIIEPVKRTVEIKSLAGKTIAVDAFNNMYQFLSSIRMPDGSPMKDRYGNITSHLIGFLSRTVNLLEQGIKPIYVFDGKPNPLKRREIDKRKIIREEAIVKMNDAKDDHDDTRSKKYAQGTTKVNKQMIEDAKKLLEMVGVPVITAEEDGEAQASVLIQDKKAWACASQDYDAFLFGADRIIRNLSASGSKKVGGRIVYTEIEYYSLDAVLKHLEITREQLIDVAILVGVDFFEGIKGIGDKTALKIIQQYGNIEGFLESDHKYSDDVIKPLLSNTYNEARQIFLHPKSVKEYSVKFNKMNAHDIQQFLVNERDFNQERVKSYINRLDSASKKCTQTRLDTFFKT